MFQQDYVVLSNRGPPADRRLDAGRVRLYAGDALDALRAALEDLSQGHWPPPRSPASLDRMIAALSRVADQRAALSGWYMVGRDPAALAISRPCSALWPRGVPPGLRQAERTATLILLAP